MIEVRLYGSQLWKDSEPGSWHYAVISAKPSCNRSSCQKKKRECFAMGSKERWWLPIRSTQEDDPQTTTWGQGNRLCLGHTVEHQLTDDFEDEDPKRPLQRDCAAWKEKIYELQVNFGSHKMLTTPQPTQQRQKGNQRETRQRWNGRDPNFQ